jgi:plasmid replication initiation protein
MEQRIILVNKANDKSLIVKSNYLIEAPYKLTIQEQRIVFMMISMLKPDDKDFNIYRVSIKYFKEMVGVKGEGSYEKLKEITIKLRKRDLVIHRPDGSELQAGWVSSADYMPGEGCVELCFDPKLKPYLLGLKEFFTKYSLDNILCLRRVYSVRLYELLKQYETIGERFVKVDTLKEMLGMTTDEYKLYGHLKERVIRPAQNELKSKTDLQFDFQEIKEGRKVKTIRFIIKPNKKKESPTQTEVGGQVDVSNSDLFQRLQASFCLSAVQARDILQNHDEDYVKSNLEVVEQAYKDGKVKRLAPYTMKAMREDFRPKKTAFDVQREQEEAKRREEEHNKKLLEDLQVQYDHHRKAEMDRVKSTLTSDELNELEAMAAREAEKNVGKQGMGFKLFQRIALEKHLTEKIDFPSFEEWASDKVGA